MATYDLRVPANYIYGQLTKSATSLDTKLTSPGFTILPANLSTTRYMPITLADDSARRYETVWITGHGAGSPTVTVVRGREATIAKRWALGSLWRCAPTARDFLTVVDTSAALPSDAHLGMRVVVHDEWRTLEKVPGGWAVTAPHGPGRRHHYNQLGGPVPNLTEPTITGWNLGQWAPGMPTNADIATMDATSGALVLNQPGVWAIMFMVWGNALPPRASRALIHWADGAWAPTSHFISQWTQTGSGWSWAGVCTHNIHWTGYVDADAAEKPMFFRVANHNATGALVQENYYLTVEYLGG